jgi:hypothetical protein
LASNSEPGAPAPALAAYFSEDDFLHGGAADSRITLRDCPVDLPLAGLGHVQFTVFSEGETYTLQAVAQQWQVSKCFHRCTA